MSSGSAEFSVGDETFLHAEIDWFLQVMRQRIRIHSGEAPTSDLMAEIAAPCVPKAGDEADCPYAGIVRKFAMCAAERLVLTLGVIPHLRPDLLDVFFIRNSAMDRRFTEFVGTSAV